MKSSYIDKLCLIMRQSDFHDFRGDGCPNEPKNEILGNDVSKVHLK